MTQYKEAFADVTEWLVENNYDGKIKTIGLCEGVDVYGLYDKEKIIYKDIQSKLLQEAKKQMIDEEEK